MVALYRILVVLSLVACTSAMAATPVVKQELAYTIVGRIGNTGSVPLENTCHSWRFVVKERNPGVTWRVHGVAAPGSPTNPGTLIGAMAFGARHSLKVRSAQPWLKIELPNAQDTRVTLIARGFGCDL